MSTRFRGRRTLVTLLVSALCVGLTMLLPTQAFALGAPSGFEGAIGDKAVGLNWQNPAGTGRAGYNIYRSTTLPVSVTQPPLNGTSLFTGQSYTNTGLTDGTTYYYVVETVDTAGVKSSPTAPLALKPMAPPAPTTPVSWLTKASSVLARAEANGVAANGKLYVFGGQFTGTTQSVRSDRYDPATDSWTQIADLPELITHAPVVADGNTLWIIGGYLGLDKKDSTDHVWKYDIPSNTYSAGPALPAPRGAGGAAIVGRTLHYFSGAVRKDSTGGATIDQPDHYVLQLDGGTSWTSAAPVPNPRNHIAAAAFGGTIYLIGGQHGAFEGTTEQQEVDAYDTATGTWTRKADLPVPRGHISASTFPLNGKIVTVGGSVVGTNAGVASNTVWQYDPASNAWTTLTALPGARKSPVADVINGQIVVNGGRTSVPTTTTWTAKVASSGDTTAPAAPTGLAASAITGPAVKLTWTANTEPDLAGYAVYRSASTPVPTTGTPLSGTTLLTSPAYTDQSVTASTTYNYVVVAKDASGNASPASTVASATTPGALPGGGAWSTGPALPQAILDGGGSDLDGKIYVVGGKTSAGPLNTVRVYDPGPRTWSTAANKPGTAVENPAVVGYNGKLYSVGGSTTAFSGAVGDLYRFDPVTNVWTTLPSMPTPRGGAAAVAVDGAIWVVGGMSGAGASLTTTEKYDIATGTWSAGPALSTPSDNPGAAAVGSTIYTFGGRTRLANGTETAPRLTTNESLSPGAGGWIARAPMPTGRRAMAVGVINAKIIAAGGERQANGATFSQTEQYDPATDSWSTLANMITPRHGAAAGVLAGQMHVIGGGTVGGSSYSAAHEIFTPSGADTTAPAAPANLASAVIAGPAVKLTWSDNTESDLAGYAVYRSASTPVPTTGTPLSGAALLTSPTYSDNTVAVGSTYNYTVVAKDTSGNTSPAAASTTATVPNAPPSNFSVKVRFSDAASTPPTGYVRDSGQSYGPRVDANQGTGYTYGWVGIGTTTPADMTAYGRIRVNPAVLEPRQLGLVHMQFTNGTKGSWEAAVPNGSYTVTVSVGDAGNFFDSVDQLNIENQNAISGFIPSAEDRFRVATRTVYVADGRLTVSPAGGTNTKINYVDVTSVPSTDVRPRVATVVPANLATNQLTDLSVTLGLALTPGGGIDTSTLTNSTVSLTNTADGSQQSAIVNTSGGGDVIVLTPDSALTNNTTYRIDVSSGVKDVSGQPFYPWSSIFTVGTISGGTGIAGVAFDKVATTASGQSFTSVTTGPDGKLYAATLDGYIFRYPIAPDGSLGAGEQINTVRTHDGGPRTIIGLAFDPASTASNLVLWITDNYQYVGTADVPNWSGKLVRLSGPALGTFEDVLINLPRSARDHETNSIAFHNGLLYFTQGSNSAMGAPDAAWAYRPEELLNAAVLRLDPTKLPTTLPLDVKTGEGGTYDPFAANAPLTIYASGVRNAFDLLWHSNGNLYAPTNGSAQGGALPATPSTLPASCQNRIDGPWTGPAAPGVAQNNIDETDWVFKITQGGYYGHPDPARCEWAFNGGNPTAGTDPFQASAYPVGVQPDRNYRASDVFDTGLHASPDGTIEYLGNNFGTKLKGKILVVRYSASQDIMVLDPSGPNGAIVSKTLGVVGFKSFNQPLDIAQDIPSGNLYVTELGGRVITRLVPRAA